MDWREKFNRYFYHCGHEFPDGDWTRMPLDTRDFYEVISESEKMVTLRKVSTQYVQDKLGRWFARPGDEVLGTPIRKRKRAAFDDDEDHIVLPHETHIYRWSAKAARYELRR